MAKKVSIRDSVYEEIASYGFRGDNISDWIFAALSQLDALKGGSFSTQSAIEPDTEETGFTPDLSDLLGDLDRDIPE